MDAKVKQTAASILGDSATGRYDLSMAFISKASNSVATGGILTSLLPASLLETRSGVAWRTGLASKNTIKLLGRFQGFNLFKNSTVEIGLLTFHKAKVSVSDQALLLVSETSREGAALRAIRLLQPSNDEGFELSSVSQSEIDSASWLPRSLKSLELKKLLSRIDLPVVSKMFEVKQGIRTGANNIFILNEQQLMMLPKAEHAWFRQAVGQGSILGGSIRLRNYVFYPYAYDGTEIRSLESLQHEVPTYFKQFLLPNQAELSQRARRSDENWWKLSEHRSWLVNPKPKIVSTYFGSSGSFSFDLEGTLAVVQGFGWIRTSVDRIFSDVVTGENEELSWEQSRTPYAFVAILNSEFFQQVLGLHCPRVQGGQFDLSARPG